MIAHYGNLSSKVGIDKDEMAKHFELTITDDSFTHQRRRQAIEAEARLDGLYVIRTNLPQETMGAEELVKSYKFLARVERVFRSLESVDLQIRPVYHWLAPLGPRPPLLVHAGLSR